MSDTTRQKLEEIFVIVLELTQTPDWENVLKDSIEKWDSLATMSLVLAIEGELGVTLDASDIEEMDSFVMAVKLVNQKCG